MLTKILYEFLKLKDNCERSRRKWNGNSQMDFEEVLDGMWSRVAQEGTTF
jgi:hypothetical protein